MLVIRQDEPRDIGGNALGPAIGCSMLASMAVGARWYTRCQLTRSLGLDDYVILISLTLAWTMTAVITAEVCSGVGLYSTPDTALAAPVLAKLVLANNVLWALTVTLTKTSILLQYLRLFTTRLARTLTYTLLCALLPAASWAIFAGILLCDPIPKLWNPSLPGTCFDAQVYWLSVAGTDISLTLLVLLLPLPAIITLRLPSTKQKSLLLAPFLLGFFVVAVSAARLASVLVASNKGDFVQAGVWAIVWSVVEANVGIVCASLLALKPLVVVFWPGVGRVRSGAQRPCGRLARVEVEVGVVAPAAVVRRGEVGREGGQRVASELTGNGMESKEARDAKYLSVSSAEGSEGTRKVSESSGARTV